MYGNLIFYKVAYVIKKLFKGARGTGLPKLKKKMKLKLSHKNTNLLKIILNFYVTNNMGSK